MNIGNIYTHTWLIVGAAALTTVLATVLFVRRAHSTSVRIQKALKKISHDMLQDIYLPDGMGGHIHIDVLLLTSRGLIILDVKDVPGTLFGSEKMTEWVTMSHRRRHTFRNPLPGLHDRLAILRAIVRDVRAEGYVVFTERGKFTKGKPSGTLMLGELVEKIGPAGNEFPQAFAPAWQQLKRIAEKAQEETQRPLDY